MATRIKKVATKPAARKRVTAKKASRKNGSQAYRTLRVSTKNDPPFFSFKVTRQTIYWSVLVFFIIIMQLWILKVQSDVVTITDQLDQRLQSEANR